jgi:hypothetical protein
MMARDNQCIDNISADGKSTRKLPIALLAEVKDFGDQLVAISLAYWQS